MNLKLPDRPWGGVLVGLMFSWAMFLFAGVNLYLGAQNLAHADREATATAIVIDTRDGREGRIEYDYPAAGRWLTGLQRPVKDANGLPPAAGSRVPVYYDTADPKVSRLWSFAEEAQRRRYAAVMWGVLGLCGFVFGFSRRPGPPV